MTEIRDYVVVEFIRSRRYFDKISFSDFNDRRKNEYESGNWDRDRFVMAVHETEKEADLFIETNKENIDRYCMFTNMSGEIFPI